MCELDFDDVIRTKEVGKLLKTLRSSLEHVEFLASFRPGHAEGEHVFISLAVSLRRSDALGPCSRVFTNNIDLVQKTNPRSVGLNCGSIDHRDPLRLSTVFSHVISPHLEHVRFQFHIKVVADLDVVDWARIEHMFTQQGFQELTIHVWRLGNRIGSETSFVCA